MSIPRLAEAKEFALLKKITMKQIHILADLAICNGLMRMV